VKAGLKRQRKNNMAVALSKGKTVYAMSFSIAGLPITRSTRTTDKVEAEAIEAKAKELLRQELKRDKNDRRPLDEVLEEIFPRKSRYAKQ
jgi:hypothetical protein